MNIIAISGSLRKKSYNTALLRAAQKIAPDMNIEILDIGHLPLYNQDLEESGFPADATRLRQRIQAADGILIAVPEFNRTIPAPLKNMLDWTSRPESEPLPWDGKPVAVMGASSGARGASFAQYHVRSVMGYFNARLMGQPEFYLGNDAEKFDANLNLTDEKSVAVLTKFLAAFTVHVQNERTPS